MDDERAEAIAALEVEADDMRESLRRILSAIARLKALDAAA